MYRVRDRRRIAKHLKCDIHQVPEFPKARWTRCECGGIRVVRMFKFMEHSVAVCAWQCKKCRSIQGVIR